MKKEALRDWAELFTEVIKIEEQVERLQDLTYVPFTTPKLTKALNRNTRALAEVEILARGASERELRKSVDDRRRALPASKRASGVPELVGRIPAHLRPRPRQVTVGRATWK